MRLILLSELAASILGTAAAPVRSLDAHLIVRQI
jgi:hypothetical protein